MLNLGGIANLTLLAADGATIGFDCGPANALMDCGASGTAASASMPTAPGRPAAASSQPLLQAMLADAYFSLPPPKSTGRDLFNARWLAAHSTRHGRSEHPADVQATLCELTASTAADALLVPCRRCLDAAGLRWRRAATPS